MSVNHKHEYEEIKERYDGLLEENTALAGRAEQAERERDAAISKVMRVVGAATTLMMAKDEEMADIATRDLENVLREQSTESHRRLKAQWQAEAIAELICEFIPWEVDGDVKAFMRQRRDELRTQINEAQS